MIFNGNWISSSIHRQKLVAQAISLLQADCLNSIPPFLRWIEIWGLKLWIELSWFSLQQSVASRLKLLSIDFSFFIWEIVKWVSVDLFSSTFQINSFITINTFLWLVTSLCPSLTFKSQRDFMTHSTTKLDWIMLIIILGSQKKQPQISACCRLG